MPTFCDEDHVKMIRMKRLEKAIPALHTIVVQLLSTTGSLKILASKGTRAEKTYQKFIAESSLCETQKGVTLLIQGTQSKHRNATSCDAKQEIIPKNLDKSGQPENITSETKSGPVSATGWCKLQLLAVPLSTAPHAKVLPPGQVLPISSKVTKL